MAEYNVQIKTFEPRDPRLGRHVRHDSRSLAYRYPETEDLTTLQSIQHSSAIPVLDQGQVGSCTGNAAIKAISYLPLWQGGFLQWLSNDPIKDEEFAVSIYSSATKLDSYAGTYPPDDTGSDGLSVAKVLKAQGFISGYQHATSLNSCLNALSKQPVIVGTSWHEDMFTPDSDGQLFITGSVEGGHEYCLDALDVEQKRVWMQNSWGETWGLNGRAWLTWEDLGTLLADQGDCTIFTPLTEPAPVPTPPEPTDVKGQFVAAAQEWLTHRHVAPPNKALVNPLRDYLASL